MLLEDAFVLRDQESLAQLFEPGAVLFAGGGLHEARGGEEIARVATEMWELGRMYFADPRRILQVRETALVLAERAINVVHRDADGLWRYAISFLDPEEAVAAGS